MSLHSAVGVIATLICSTLPAATADVKQVKLEQTRLRITENVRITPGVYELFDRDDQGAVSIIGSPAGTEPDAFVGSGLVIRGRNVTLINANIRGYKVGVFAEDCPGITISGCDVSGNYRQRLKSTVEREDLSDWLYGHENDANEWLRYGAGIYLFRCPGATVTNCRARNGQNGLCMVHCDRARVVDNDMSFLSGWGLAMWRSSHCEVFNNKFDWCIRGYSHGVYSRGQDSTGILVYEQCRNNLFAYNSATHGGDGFFLYAGNETLKKTGRGGCNGNILYRNDFSHAAANGIEATFSDGNIFIENTLDECTHGVWAGYSYNTIIESNNIRNCTYGVSIEHGRNNRIAGNTISDTRLGVHLWWDDDDDLLTSTFGKVHDRCASSNNTVAANSFKRVKTAVHLVDDTNSVVAANKMKEVDVPVHLKGSTDGVRLGLSNAQRMAVKKEASGFASFDVGEAFNWKPLDIVARQPRLLTKQGKQDAFLPNGNRRGRKFIFVDEWGPYDFTNLRLFPSKVLGSGPRAAIQLLGPDSTFRVTSVTGRVKVSPVEGRLPTKLMVETAGPGLHTFAIDVKCDGRMLHATGTLLNTGWRVTFYQWSKSNDPRNGAEEWHRIISSTPLDEITVPAVDFMWYTRAPSDKVSRDRFATVATANVQLPAGTWRIETTSDDGVRVFVNDRPVINNWTWHAATSDEATVKLETGEHHIRVEHFEVDGFAQLQFRLEPAPP